MKHFTCFCFILLLWNVTVAQTSAPMYASRSKIVYTDFSAYPSPDIIKLPDFNVADDDMPPGARMAGWGKGLTIGGTVVFIAGIAILANAVDNQQMVNGQYVENDGPIVLGVAMYISGVAMIGTGIPLWIVGTIKYNKYKAKQKLVFNMKGAGGQLSYRF